MRFLICIVFVFWHSYTAAWPPTFGAEFTFTNEVLRGKPSSKEVFKVQDILINAVLDACKPVGCYKDRGAKAGAKIIYPDGWWMQITTDP